MLHNFRYSSLINIVVNAIKYIMDARYPKKVAAISCYYRVTVNVAVDLTSMN